jgi:hypothetical protein
VHLRQLLDDRLAGDVSEAKCFALDADEARAEKVRAAFTREAVRDFYIGVPYRSLLGAAN